MNLQMKPELRTFINDQVKAGRFTSPEAAIEAAVDQMRVNVQYSAMTQEDIEAIKEADAQIERGEYVDFHEFAAEMRKKLKAG